MDYHNQNNPEDVRHDEVVVTASTSSTGTNADEEADAGIFSLWQSSSLLQSLWDQLAHETTPNNSVHNGSNTPALKVVAMTAGTKATPNQADSAQEQDFRRRTDTTPSTLKVVAMTTGATATADRAPLIRDEEEENDHDDKDDVICPLWTRLTEDGLHRWLRASVVQLGTFAARHPWTTVILTVLISFGVVIAGLFTNAKIVYKHREVFTPMNSYPALHGQWYDEQSGFEDTLEMNLIIHSHGDNVLQVPAVLKAFEALGIIQNTPGYAPLCAQSTYIDPDTKENTCWIWSVTEFWDHNRTLFEQEFSDPNNANSTDDLIRAVSQSVTKEGFPIFHEVILGAFEKAANYSSALFPEAVGDDDKHSNMMIPYDASSSSSSSHDDEKEGQPSWFHHMAMHSHSHSHDDSHEDFDSRDGNATTRPPRRRRPDPDFWLQHVPAFIVSIGFPPADNVYEFQEVALKNLQALQQQWIQQEGTDQNPLSLRLEFFCSYAYELEYERAMEEDMPLVPAVFFVMLFFTMFVFHQYTGSNSNNNSNNNNKSCWASRSSLGLASVATIGLSLMSGFGMCFCWGIPFSNITQMVPFIILGVGLDDTFILTGAYFRRLQQSQKEEEEDARAHVRKGPSKKASSGTASYPFDAECGGQPQKQDAHSSTIEEDREERVVQRIHDTLNEVGLSISLTTITTTSAFVLGVISTVPGIRWLCIYASVTVVFDFLYQVTFFLALLVLDERRVAGTLFKGSCWRCICEYCFCCCMCFRCVGAPGGSDSPAQRRGSSNLTHPGSSMDLVSAAFKEAVTKEQEEFFMDRAMRWYARQLLRPGVKVVVIMMFLAVTGLNIYSASMLEQQFNIEDYVPKESYTRSFLGALEDYTSLRASMAVYFRDVDQSDPEIQRQMLDYIDEISKLPQIDAQPQTCWIRDMYEILSVYENVKDMDWSNSSTTPDPRTSKKCYLAQAVMEANITFEERLDVMMNVPVIRDVYGWDIVRDEEGRITTSRCYFNIKHIDLHHIDEQIAMLEDQRDVTLSQPINQHLGKNEDLPFFAYDDLFGYWELYTVAIQELIFTTIWGVVAVCVVGFVIIPHWTAVCFVGPLIVMLYFNLLGTMQFCGIYINTVTYVTVVISIGLLVDFLMHILLRYYETKGRTREEKVKETLETMGVSMMLGGFTTWLGVIPLAFSTTKIFMTLFIAFFAMVTWGLLVGLVFLPVLLSIFGPVVTTATSVTTKPPKKKKVAVRGRKLYGSDLMSSSRYSQTEDETVASHRFHESPSPCRSARPSLSVWVERTHSLSDGDSLDDDSFVTCVSK